MQLMRTADRTVEPFRTDELKNAINIKLARTFFPKHIALEMERPQNLSFAVGAE